MSRPCSRTTVRVVGRSRRAGLDQQISRSCPSTNGLQETIHRFRKLDQELSGNRFELLLQLGEPRCRSCCSTLSCSRKVHVLVDELSSFVEVVDAQGAQSPEHRLSLLYHVGV